MYMYACLLNVYMCMIECNITWICERNVSLFFSFGATHSLLCQEVDLVKRAVLPFIHCLFQVSDTLSTAEKLMKDLSAFQSFVNEAMELKDELHDYQREQFDGWSRLTLAAIDDKSQALR